MRGGILAKFNLTFSSVSCTFWSCIWECWISLPLTQNAKHSKNIFEAKYKTRGLVHSFIHLTFIDYSLSLLYFTKFYHADSGDTVGRETSIKIIKMTVNCEKWYNLPMNNVLQNHRGWNNNSLLGYEGVEKQLQTHMHLATEPPSTWNKNWQNWSEK